MAPITHPASPTAIAPYHLNRVSTAYLLWLIAFIVPGLHRFYNKKYASGLLWFFTIGFFGIGQLLDLFFIPGMVEEHNLKQQMRFNLSTYGHPLGHQPAAQQVVDVSVVQTLTAEEKMLKLLKAAHKRGGSISVTQAVLDTELGFGEVEETFKQMVKMGYVQVSNDLETGIVTYHFMEL